MKDGIRIGRECKKENEGVRSEGRSAMPSFNLLQLVFPGCAVSSFSPSSNVFVGTICPVSLN